MIQRALGVALISCLTLQGCSVEEQRRAMVAANADAIREARKIQDEIAATLQCPTQLPGWQLDRDPIPRLVRPAGTPEVQFELRFACERDLTFTILVSYSFDSGTYVSGGTTGPLEIDYGHFTDMHTIKVSRSDDAEAIATRVVHEPA